MSRKQLDEQQRQQSLVFLRNVLTDAELSSDLFRDSFLRDTMLITDLSVDNLSLLYLVFLDIMEADFFLYRLKKSLSLNTRFFSSDALEFILWRAYKKNISFRNVETFFAKNITTV